MRAVAGTTIHGSMKPRIRRIRADEGSRLRALRLRALAEAPLAYGSTLAREQDYPDDLWRERALDASAGCDGATFIAERDGQWLGLATGFARADEPESAGSLLVGMFVDGTARRLGVGVELVEAVASWARACGSARLALWVTSGNEPATALYGRCGFRPTGATRPLSHAPALAECEMIRELD
jgi:GNAT superfamily N-acetyltransferase